MEIGNELAFPFIEEANSPDSVNFGLTKREYFAGLAMQGLLASEIDEASSAEGIAMLAVDRADALLKRLNHRSEDD